MTRRVFILSVAITVLTALIGVGCATSSGSSASGSSVRPWYSLTPMTKLGQASPRFACDPISIGNCLLPFPDNYETTVDPMNSTGLRVSAESLTRVQNTAGQFVNTTPWNESDGFSPGSEILADVPGISLAKSQVATEGTIGESLSRDAPIVLLDVTTGQRWPYWGSFDVNTQSSKNPLLIVNPARAMNEGDTYVVDLRDLKDSSGKTIAPQMVFKRFLSGQVSGARDKARLSRVRSDLAALASAGVSKSGTYLVWDFTIGSRKSITGRLLSMRDQAFQDLKGRVPDYSVSKVTDYSYSQNQYSSRLVTGTFDVPSFLDEPGGPPGSSLRLNASGTPRQMPGNIEVAPFTCLIPRSADASPDNPQSPVHRAYPSLYGHGLFGNAQGEVPDLKNTGNSNNIVFCGTDWLGMSINDIPTTVPILKNVSLFPSMPDRLDQAMVDFMYLGTLMDSPKGFAANSAFEASNSSHSPLLLTGHDVFYYGNSLGGILGGTLTAVSNGIYRSVLGVPGIDFSVMIQRSVDFAPFFSVIKSSYPDPTTRQVLFDMIQILWDRADPDGYAQYMTNNPLPNTHSHEVLIEFAFGDHQVPNVGTEMEIRTVGAELHAPALEPGRSPVPAPFWGIPKIRSYPYKGSAAFIWDNGVPAPPEDNQPNNAGNDPHNETPRRLPEAQSLLGDFLIHGLVENVCGPHPCLSPPMPKTQL